MAITTTSLASAMLQTDQTFKATAATGATAGGIAKIDNEYCQITAISGVQISVARRGDLGGAVTAHGVLAPVQFGVASDFPAIGQNELIPEPAQENFRSVGANGAIACPVRNTTFVIMKGSALASSTLADPTAGQNGLEVTFIGGTDFAHVVTVTTGFDGTTGTTTTLTSPAFKGGSLTLVAYNAGWYVKSNNLWVLT